MYVWPILEMFHLKELSCCLEQSHVITVQPFQSYPSTRYIVLFLKGNVAILSRKTWLPIWTLGKGAIKIKGCIKYACNVEFLVF